MISYNGKLLEFTGCAGCAFAKHEFELDCGMAYQDDDFTVSQDWELPIPGFYVICPVKKHVETLTELSDETVGKMFNLAKKVHDILNKHDIAKNFNLVIHEKKGVHLHLWIMPQYDWMNAKKSGSMGYIKEVFDYAKNNFRTEETFKRINEINDIVKKELN